MSEYNGWSNRETWLINLHFGEHLQSEYDDGVLMDRDDIETFIYDQLDGVADPTNIFLNDIIGSFISKVNLDELVSHYSEED